MNRHLSSNPRIRLTRRAAHGCSIRLTVLGEQVLDYFERDNPTIDSSAPISSAKLVCLMLSGVQHTHAVPLPTALRDRMDALVGDMDVDLDEEIVGDVDLPHQMFKPNKKILAMRKRYEDINRAREEAARRGRMTGLFHRLSETQRAKVLAYDEPEYSGGPMEEYVNKPGEWQPMKDAPRDRPILLWGKLRNPGLTQFHPDQKIRVVGYWDEIDSAWAVSCMPWDGPFFSPVLWAEIPDVPCSQLERMLDAVNESETRISDSE